MGVTNHWTKDKIPVSLVMFLSLFCLDPDLLTTMDEVDSIQESFCQKLGEDRTKHFMVNPRSGHDGLCTVLYENTCYELSIVEWANDMRGTIRNISLSMNKFHRAVLLFHVGLTGVGEVDIPAGTLHPRKQHSVHAPRISKIRL